MDVWWSNHFYVMIWFIIQLKQPFINGWPSGSRIIIIPYPSFSIFLQTYQSRFHIVLQVGDSSANWEYKNNPNLHPSKTDNGTWKCWKNIDPNQELLGWKHVFFFAEKKNIPSPKRKTSTSWWLNQPIWKIWVKLDHFPRQGLKIKIIELPPPRTSNTTLARPWNSWNNGSSCIF